MKKKFINGLLLVALFVGFTSSMVSCKDYDDEKITNLEGKLADEVNALKAQLDAQKAALEKQIKDVEDLQKQCQQNCKTFQENITNQLKLYVTQENFIATLKDSLGNYYTKKEVDGKITYVLQYTDTQVENLRTAMLDSLDKYVRKEALAQSIADLLNDGKNVMTTALDAYLNGFIAPYDQRIGANEANIDSLQRDVIKLNQAIDQARAIAESAKTLAEKDSIRIDGLDKLVGELGDKVLKIREDLDKVTKTANDAWALAQANEKAINKLDSCYTALDDKVQKLDNKVEGYYTALDQRITDNKEKVDSLRTDFEAFKTEADSIHKELDKRIGAVDADLTEFKQKVLDEHKLAMQYLNAVLSWLISLDDYVWREITGIEINGTYNPMFGELALPFNIRSNMLVVFRGETSDRGLQFPSRAQYLAALPEFWGSGNFTDEDLNILGISALSKVKGYVRIGENEDIVGSQYEEDGETLVKEGNAGTIYLTVNPTDRDFSGTEFTLINSLNEEVPAVLSPLKKSNHKLTFGYTRAGVDDGEDGELQSSNGFYETQVTVSAEDAKNMGLRINLDDIKDVAATLKDFMNEHVSLTTVMNGVYNSINDLLDASALKATWEAYDKPLSTVSQYAIGVAGIKPLSFGFGKDLHLDGIPGTQKAEDLLNNIINVVVEGLPDMDFINRFDIEKLELDELTSELNATIRVHLGSRYIISTGPKTATFWFPTFDITGTNGEHVTITNTHPEVTVTMDGTDSVIEVTLYMGDFIRYMGLYDTEDIANNFSTIKKQFNLLLDQINDFLTSITEMNFTTMGNNAFGQFKKFIDDLNVKFSRFFEPNRFFRTTVVVKSGDRMVHLSTLPKHPAKVTGTALEIIPSNFNAEMLSPAFKKFIAVTDVKKDGKSAKGGDADCKSILDAANQTPGFMEVIDGGFNPISFTGKAGYSYEFIYSAVDFSGKILTRKFYMTVK